MSKKRIALSLMLLITVCTSIYIIIKTKYKAPRSSQNISNSVVWNADKGEYYNADSFIWNAEKQTYEPKPVFIPQGELKNKAAYVSPENFIKNNENTNDIIDRALVNYYKKVQEIYNSNNISISQKVSSQYTPNKDEALKEITSLGVKHIGEMIKRIKNNHQGSDYLMYSVNSIGGVKDLDSYVSASSEGIKLWQAKFKDKLSNVKSKVKETSEKLKKDKSANSIKKAKSDLEPFGIFSLPYIIDEINNDNDEIIEILPDIANIYTKSNKEKLNIKDKSGWIQWFKENEEGIKALRNIVNDI